MKFRLLALALALLLATAPALAQSTTYPLTIENGDRELVFSRAPERAVSLNGHTTEIMLSLGLADRMVGTAYNNGVILPELKAGYDRVPVLSGSDQYPSTEVLVGSGADFTYGRLSAYRDTGVGTFDKLAELGINAYAVKGTLINNATMDDVYEDISKLGQIFDIQDRANALIDKMKAEIATTHAKVADIETPVKVMVFDSGKTDIYTAGKSLETYLVALAGGENVFDDNDDTWAHVSYELAVERDPDVIVINDYGNETAQQKIDALKANPALASISAIRDDRFVVLPLFSVFEGVRNPDAVRVLASGFYPDRFQ
jgi:iron complex transport system substrate-binding protein